MARFRDSKPKPMKQVLESLIAILLKSSEQSTKDAIVTKIASETVPSIILGEPRSRIKASLTTLETLIRKNAILPMDLISMVRRWLLEEPSRWITLLEPDCKALSININQFLQQAANDSIADQASQKVAAEILVLRLLSQTKSLELAAAAGDVMSIFLQKMKAQYTSNSDIPESTQDLVSVWVAPVRHMVLQDIRNLDSMSNHVLQPLFTVDFKGFRRFVDSLHLNSLLTGDMSSAPTHEFILLFAALQMAKKIGLVHEDHYFSRAGTSSNKAEDALVLKSEVIGQFLFHQEFSVRIAALSLLVTAPISTKPVSSATMKAILKGLPPMHAESNSYSRGGLLSGEEDLSQRVVASKKQQPTFARDDSETLACLKDYIAFLKSDLRPTASYPRHITSLKSLILFLDSGLDSRFEKPAGAKSDGIQTKWKLHIEVFEPSLLRLLVDLLLDPFDDVRATSLAILKLFPLEVVMGSLQSATGTTEDRPQIINALAKAELLASNTSRADYADTVARLYQITFSAAAQTVGNSGLWWHSKSTVVGTILRKLEEKLSAVGGLFKSSMRDAPLHGYVSALRYIISMPNFYLLVQGPNSKSHENWRNIHSRIVALCDRIWEEVKPVLCIDSPEGHTDEPIEELGVGPKDILSYSWRGLRESSLLLYATLVNDTYAPKGPSGLSSADYEKLGSTSFTQLAELRHRGAFSTVSQTFATCCLRCGQSKDQQISALPGRWYQEARKIIFESGSKLTRRSAGLPALATGILHSQPGGPLFRQVMGDLHEIAHLPVKDDNEQKAMNLPQVHAMNCLKDIFTNNRLGPHTEPFIMSGLTLSAEQIGSPIWDLRNSGMMLFRALLTRMCRTGTGLGFGGVSGSEPGGRVSFGKYPGLIELLSGLLTSKERNNAEHGDHAIITERAFPALELLAEKVPNAYLIDDDMLRGLVLEQLKSPVWGMREHAARVYASLMNPTNILQNVQELLDIDQDSKSQDYLHGKALAIKYALRRLSMAYFALWKEHIPEVSAFIRRAFSVMFSRADSPFVATALLEILSDAVEKATESKTEEKFIITLTYIYDMHGLHDILDYIFDSSNPSWKSLSTNRASSLLRRALSWVALLQAFIENEFDELQPFIKTVSAFDSNVGTWLLEKVQDTFSQKETHQKVLLDLYSSILLTDYPEDVKSSVTSHLASILESILGSQSDKIKEIDLPWDKLDNHINATEHGQIWNRDRGDAELRLQGCVLAAKSISNTVEVTRTDIARWSTKLRFAVEEETEFTTRYAAAASLMAFSRALRTAHKTPRTEEVFLDVYLVLYDLLNDDDEELRDIAASTASWVLSFSSVSPAASVTLSPLNASELLSRFVADNYCDSRALSTKAIRYVTGQWPRVNGSTQRTDLTPVPAIVAELMKESTILFEEEKQNLFIEEVREADVWSQRLRSLSRDAYNEQLVKTGYAWASGGLTCLNEIASSPSGYDGLMGWTSKPEMFSLGIRVINLAAVLVSKDFAGAEYLGGGQEILKNQLQAFLNTARTAIVHDDWLSRLKAAANNT
ncbi:putative death-receptor fusion protein-domain-containing protein [Aspergillus floccosus]